MVRETRVCPIGSVGFGEIVSSFHPTSLQPYSMEISTIKKQLYIRYYSRVAALFFDLRYVFDRIHDLPDDIVEINNDPSKI